MSSLLCPVSHTGLAPVCTTIIELLGINRRECKGGVGGDGRGEAEGRKGVGEGRKEGRGGGMIFCSN